MGWRVVERRLGKAGGVKQRAGRQREWDRKYGEDRWAIGYEIDRLQLEREQAERDDQRGSDQRGDRGGGERLHGAPPSGDRIGRTADALQEEERRA